MTRSNFLMAATVVAAVFGLAFLVAPSQLVALYGVTLTPQGRAMLDGASPSRLVAD